MVWHRGLLSVRPARHFRVEPLLEMAAWLDTLQFEVGGRVCLRRILGVVAQLEINHLWLDLRIAMSEQTLLEELSALPGSACLRSLTFGWPLRMLDHQFHEEGQTPLAFPAASVNFLERLLRQCPVGASLTHLASEFPFRPNQCEAIGALGVEPVHVDRRWWMHLLPASSFRSRTDKS
jgi:hypothetical protein